jgi:hypothetical protein
MLEISEMTSDISWRWIGAAPSGDGEFQLRGRIHALGLSCLADPKAAWRRLARR